MEKSAAGPLPRVRKARLPLEVPAAVAHVSQGERPPCPEAGVWLVKVPKGRRVSVGWLEGREVRPSLPTGGGIPYQQVIEAMQAGIWILDDKGCTTFANPYLATMLGYTLEAMLDRPLSSFLERDNGTASADALRPRGQCPGDPQELELVRQDGSRFHASLRLSPLVGPDGQFVGTLAAVHKVTAHRQTVDAMQESEQPLLASIVQSCSEAIVSTTLDGIILSWNPGAERMFGYSASETLGRCITHLAPPEVSEDVRHLLDQVRLGNQIEHYEMRGPTKDGRPIEISVTMSPIRDARGRVERTAIFARDITDWKRAERAMRDVNDRLQISIRERTRDLLWVNEELLTLASAERAEHQVAELLTRASLVLSQTLTLEPLLETLLDYLAELVPYDTAEVLLWQSPTDLAVPVVRGYEWCGDDRDSSAITPRYGTNPYADRVLGEQTCVLIVDTGTLSDWRHPLAVEHARGWLAVPLVAGDKVIGLCGLGSTKPNVFTQQHVQFAQALASQAAVAVQNAWLFEQVRAGRERLQALARGLVEVQESERRYVARELHDEAGQALSSLMMGLGLLERDAHRPEAVIAGIAELRRIADSVMEDLHRLAVDLRPCSLDRLGLVATLAQHIESISEKHDLTIQLETIGLDGRLQAEVETALYRIAQEALTNVVRHARATRVDVLLQAEDHQVSMIVEDNGTGFDPASVRNHGRLGLLGIRERAEMLGGKLAIESTPGIGTALILEIPL